MFKYGGSCEEVYVPFLEKGERRVEMFSSRDETQKGRRRRIPILTSSECDMSYMNELACLLTSAAALAFALFLLIVLLGISLSLRPSPAQSAENKAVVQL